MQKFVHHNEVRAVKRATAVAIGIFDGVHLGHQALLNRAVSLGREAGLCSLAYTFTPHPARVLNPELAPELIEPVSERLVRMEALGLEAALVQPFDRDYAKTSAEDFVMRVLVESMAAKHVVVGAGFTFGSKQRGNVALLQALGATHGFEVHPVDHVRADGIEVSSTKIREFVHTGHPYGATLLLGRHYAVFGTVEHGAHRGGTIGFPTANVRVENELHPAGGVYAGRAHVPTGVFNCVINVGNAPTFGAGNSVKVEAHLLDYPGTSLYDQRIRLDIQERLRDEQRFDGIDALKAQIGQDVERAGKILPR